MHKAHLFVGFTRRRNERQRCRAILNMLHRIVQSRIPRRLAPKQFFTLTRNLRLCLVSLSKTLSHSFHLVLQSPEPKPLKTTTWCLQFFFTSSTMCWPLLSKSTILNDRRRWRQRLPRHPRYRRAVFSASIVAEVSCITNRLT